MMMMLFLSWGAPSSSDVTMPPPGFDDEAADDDARDARDVTKRTNSNKKRILLRVLCVSLDLGSVAVMSMKSRPRRADGGPVYFIQPFYTRSCKTLWGAYVPWDATSP